MALKDIKAKIQATNRMHTVTRAMEAVSAVKMRKTQSSAFAGRPYARAALSILARVAGASSATSNPLMEKRDVKKVALVVMTSDKGLAGSLNSGVIKRAFEIANKYTKEEVTVYAYGKKGQEFFSRRSFTVAQSFENKSDNVPLAVMQELATVLSNGFVKNEYDEVIAVYSNFKSTFEQEPTARTLLPLSLSAVSDLVSDIRPAKGKWSETKEIEAPVGYEVESHSEDILSILIPKLVSISLYHMLLESKASEHSARMVAMKSASDKSKEVARDLSRVYNKVRQAAITREVSEIVSGRVAAAT